jgi:hypothetical protein
MDKMKQLKELMKKTPKRNVIVPTAEELEAVKILKAEGYSGLNAYKIMKELFPDRWKLGQVRYWMSK